MRIALIGLGKAGIQHAEACLKAGDVDVVGVADPAPAAAEEASRLGIRHAPDWRELVGRERPDGVIVSLPHGLLADVAVDCARRGLHILLEKPMGVTLAEADAVVAAARESGARLMVNFVHRFRAEFRTAKRLIESGAIGRPTLVFDQLTSGRSPLPGWVWDKAMGGGGMMMYNGVHSVDRLTWLAGSPIARIGGAVASLSYEQETEDTSVASIVFKSGALGALVNQKTDTPTTLGGWQAQVWGTKGCVRVLTGGGLEVASDKERMTLTVQADDRFLGAVREFVDAVQAGRDPVPSGEDGRHALAAVMALYESAKTGAMQEI